MSHSAAQDATFCVEDSRQKELCRAELTYVLVLALGPEGWRTAAYSEGYESLVAAQDASSNLTSLSEAFGLNKVQRDKLLEALGGKLPRSIVAELTNRKQAAQVETSLYQPIAAYSLTALSLLDSPAIGAVICQLWPGNTKSVEAGQEEPDIQLCGALAAAVVESDAVSPTFCSVSNTFRAMLRYKIGELEGEMLTAALLHPEAKTAASTDFLMAANESRAHAASLLCRRRDGAPFYAFLTLMPVLGTGLPTKSGSIDRGQRSFLLLTEVTGNPQQVEQYLLGKLIGKGSFGIVQLGKDIATGEKVAVKVIKASQLRSIRAIEQVQDEMAVLSSLRHPNIVRLRSVHFLKPTACYYFVMDLANGGSLAELLATQPRHRLPEDQARHIFGDIVHALAYCHRRRLVHRDLKPENILLRDGTAMVSDFGLVGMTTPLDGALHALCGTPEFCAPEVHQAKPYGPAVDIWEATFGCEHWLSRPKFQSGYLSLSMELWHATMCISQTPASKQALGCRSLGVILYEMIQGHLPFRGGLAADLAAAICGGVYLAPSQASKECCSMIASLLKTQLKERLTIDQIQKHPWLAGDTAELGPASRQTSLEAAMPVRAESLDAAVDFGATSERRMRSSLRLILPPLDSGCEALGDQGVAEANKGLADACPVPIPTHSLRAQANDLSSMLSSHASLRRARNSVSSAATSTGHLKVRADRQSPVIKPHRRASEIPIPSSDAPSKVQGTRSHCR